MRRSQVDHSSIDSSLAYPFLGVTTRELFGLKRFITLLVDDLVNGLFVIIGELNFLFF